MKVNKIGVSAVIPSFNCKEKLFRLIKSLQKSDLTNLEIIVVDNGSQDKTLEEGRKIYSNVKWIDAGLKNIGQTGCYNLGFAAVKKTNHILYIDADVIVEKDMISRLVEATDLSPKIGIVTPMILYLNNKNWVNQAGANVDLMTGRVKVGWGKKEDWLLPQEVQNSGTVMLFKREVVDKIGGVDNWFLCYFDPDYCLRAKKAGYVTWYEPRAVCYHDQPIDSNLWRPRVLQRAFLLGRNRVLFMRRHGNNLLIFTISLIPILGYYLYESIKFNQFNKFPELVKGTIAGFFYPLRKSNYVPLPKVKL